MNCAQYALRHCCLSIFCCRRLFRTEVRRLCLKLGVHQAYRWGHRLATDASENEVANPSKDVARVLGQRATELDRSAW
jgi:hypothetical protein